MSIRGVSGGGGAVSGITQAQLTLALASKADATADDALSVLQFRPRLAAVASVTVPSPGSAQANEFAHQAACGASPTDGGTDWGFHQNRFVRMQDGTEFIAFATSTSSSDMTTGDIIVMRWGGNLGYPASAGPTEVLRISKALCNSKDNDYHLLRNPATNQVHLITSWRDENRLGAPHTVSVVGTTYSVGTGVPANDNLDYYKIWTLNTDGTLDHTQQVQDVWQDSGLQSVEGWFVPTMGTAYSTCGIGDDGTIVFTTSISQGTYNGQAASEMDAFKRYQLWRYNGGSWRFSPIKNKLAGERIGYERIYVNPPGRRGYIVAVGGRNVKYNEYNARYNATVYASSPNMQANATYFGSGRYAAICLWEVPLGDLDSFTHQDILPFRPRATDLPGSPVGASYQGYLLQDVLLDTKGRFWVATSEGDGASSEVRCMTVFTTATKAQLARQSGTVTGGNTYGFHEDENGKMWVGYVSSGNTMDARLLQCTLSGSTLTVQSVASATSQASTAWCRDTTNEGTTGSVYHGLQIGAFTAEYRSGSVLAPNYMDMVVVAAPNHTGGSPGTTITAITYNTGRIKRVRIKHP